MKSKKMTAGFTLVELIVVIAILGILAGVGTVGYSGYIKKANMAADQQLIAGVKNALTLASYSGELKQDGFVILSKDGADYGTDDTNAAQMAVKAAIEAAFGANADMKLKYDWTDETNADVMSILKGQGTDMATAVAGSTYAANVTQLLGDAENCTSALADFMHRLISNDAQQTYDKLAQNSSGLNSIMATAGLIEVDSDGSPVLDASGNAQLVDASNTTNTQMSNALLLAIASEIGTTSNLDGATIMEQWGGGTTGMSLLAETATNYAYLESSVKYLNDPELNAAFDTMNAEFESADDASAVISSMDKVSSLIEAKKQALAETNMDGYLAYITQLQNDAKAFAGVMNAVSQVKDNYADKDILAKEDMYTSGEIANLANSYVTAASCYSALPDDLPEGAVMVTYSSVEQSVYSVPSV